MTNALKIIGLKITGVRKLSAIEMEFDCRGLIPIVGGNKQGKTTVLDSLEILFTGVKAVPRDIIQHGKDRAEIVGKVGEYEIKRVITEKSNRLVITNAAGLEMTKKPQAFLDTLKNELTFDPWIFLNKTPEKKLQALMTLLKIDFSAQNEKIKELEQERILVGREAKAFGEVQVVEAVEAVELESLFEEKRKIEALNQSKREGYQLEKDNALRKIIIFNDNQKECKVRYDKSVAELDSIRESEKEIKGKIEALEKALSRVVIVRAKQVSFIANLAEPQPLKPLEVNVELPTLQTLEINSLETQIKEAGETNRKAALYDAYLEKLRSKVLKENSYKSLTGKIEAQREEKQAILKQTKMPVPGLEIKDDGVFLNGIFSENWSESEGITASAELCIAMNPKLRVISIDKGESYDKESLKALEAWAIKNDLQAFIAIVDEIPEEMEPGTFYIEDGTVMTAKEEVSA
jgi:predicted ATP-dependent endonuclease of OLD family